MHVGLTPGIFSCSMISSWANAKGIISQSEPPLNPSSFTSFYYKHQHISSSLFLITNIGLFSSPLKYTAWDTVSGHSSSYRNFLRTNLGIVSTAHTLSHILRHPDGQLHRMQTPRRLVHSFELQDNLKRMSPLPTLKGCTLPSATFWVGLRAALLRLQFLFLFEHMAWGFPIGSKGNSEESRECARTHQAEQGRSITSEGLGTALRWGMLDDGLFLTWSYPQY